MGVFSMGFFTILQNATDADEESASMLHRIQQLRCLGSTTVEVVAFWTAVVLPAPTIILVTFGVSTRTELFVVAGLLCGNLAALYLGHDYSGSRSNHHSTDS